MDTILQQHDPFFSLYGQERARLILSKSLRSNRIAHAFLFRGPDGVGKTRFAMNMAKALNCREQGPEMWCGACPSCIKFNAANHPDFILEVPEKQTIKIDRVRNIAKSLNYQPYESRFRVVVLEDIHSMRTEAANCLLKTLEEPPERNILILTAETSKEVLQTIISRCQVIPFFSLKYSDTSEILIKEHGIEKEEADILAKLSDGSPGRALLLQKMDMIPLYKKIVAHLSKNDENDEQGQGKILQLADELAQLKENIPLFLGLLRLWLRDCLLEMGLSKRRTTAIYARLDAVSAAEKQLGRNCNRSLVCEILLFRLQ